MVRNKPFVGRHPRLHLWEWTCSRCFSPDSWIFETNWWTAWARAIAHDKHCRRSWANGKVWQ